MVHFNWKLQERGQMEVESEGAEAVQPVAVGTGSGVGTSSPEVPGDHSYCKVSLWEVSNCMLETNCLFVFKCPPSNAELMETENQSPQSSESRDPVWPTLTSLDKTQDNFESLLLLLLQAYTTQNCPGKPSILGGAPISGEALDTLSPEQITALITSNSVNYEVIQQILAQQKGRPSVAGRFNSPLQDQNQTLSLGEEVQEDSSKSPTPIQSPSGSESHQQMQQLIQITPQQLEVLQSQVNELLQSQHITLPADLSPEQQQQLIQTLLLRQLQIQQSGGAISVKDASMSMNQLLSGTSGQGKQAQACSKEVGVTVKEEDSGSGSPNESGGKAKEVEKSSAKGAQTKKVRS